MQPTTGSEARLPEQQSRVPDHVLGESPVRGYKIEALVAMTRYAKVHNVTGPEPDDMAVLKCFREPEPERPAVLRWEREIRGRAALDGAGVVPPLIDSGTCERGHPFILMEYRPGRTLADWINSDEIVDPADLLRCLAEVARAIGALHDRGVVHADIKPENVLVLSDGTPRLIDFGSARVAETDQPRKPRVAALDRLRSALGSDDDARIVDAYDPILDDRSDIPADIRDRLALAKFRLAAEVTPAYAAPEVLASAVAPDQAADMYSFGVMVLTLVGGGIPGVPLSSTRPPEWTEPPPFQERRAIHRDLLESNLPAGLAGLISKALAPDPDDRPTAEDAERALEMAASEVVRRRLEPPTVDVIYGEQKITMSPGQRLVVGRGEHADLRIGEDPAISREAVSISCEPAGVLIRNEGRRAIQVGMAEARHARLGASDALLTQAHTIDVTIEGLRRHTIQLRRDERPLRMLARNRNDRPRGHRHLSDHATEPPTRGFVLRPSDRALIAAYAEPLLTSTATRSATHTEVAQRLGRSMYTVRNRLAATIARYREHLPPQERMHVDRDSFFAYLIEAGELTPADLALLAGSPGNPIPSRRQKMVYVAKLAPMFSGEKALSLRATAALLRLTDASYTDFAVRNLWVAWVQKCVEAGIGGLTRESGLGLEDLGADQAMFLELGRRGLLVDEDLKQLPQSGR